MLRVEVALAIIIFVFSALFLIGGLNKGWLVWTMLGSATFICTVSKWFNP